MRYSTPVTFIVGSPLSEYNPDTGKHEKLPQEEVVKSCHVSDMAESEMLRLFGRTDVQAYTVYHLGKQIKNVDRVKISKMPAPFGVTSDNEATYNVIQARQVRNKATYVVSRDLS